MKTHQLRWKKLLQKRRFDLTSLTNRPSKLRLLYIPNAFPGDDMEARWMGVRHLTQTYTLEALGIIENGTTATLTVTDRPASNGT